MSRHEKQLLIITSFLIIMVVTGLVIISLIAGNTAFFLLSIIQRSWLGFVFFILLGSIGSYYEIAIVSPAIYELEKSQVKWPVDYSTVLGMGITLVICLVPLALVTYGTDEKGLLEAATNLVIAGLGFSLVICMMFVTALVFRLVMGVKNS